jgi:hypothetical protein
MNGKIFLSGLVAVLVGIVTPAVAQAPGFVFEGYNNCTRATNGRAYCQRPGSETYNPVNDTFMNRYQAAMTAATTRPQTVIQNNTINQTVVIQRLETESAELRGMMDLFRVIIAEQRRQTSGSCQVVANQTATVITAQISEMQGRFVERTTELSKYVTSVRPNDPDRRITARRASELFPKIPFVIRGTPEQGEFWLEPSVSDTGVLSFNLKFIDINSGIEKVRGTVPLSSLELATVRDALCKLNAWSETAHKNRVIDFTKRVVCFPEPNCPEESGKRDGVASVEIIFGVDGDGRTGGRIQRNRGRIAESYDISIESAMLLQAYLNHILVEGTTEFDAGSRTTEQKRELFQ